jgi:uncharacterized repeat protein (TIGR03803 family)
MPLGRDTLYGFVAVCTLAGGLSIATVNAASGFSEKVLYAFQGGSDGAGPWGGLIPDNTGKLYGTTIAGGGGTGCDTGSQGCGTVFKLAPDGTEHVLYAFKGGSDGAFPETTLTVDMSGNFYGTTTIGGTGSCNCGTIFKVARDGKESVLYSFQGGGSDGYAPVGGLTQGSQGNLYGTTFAGGNNVAECGGEGKGCGTMFKVSPDGTETVLYIFCSLTNCSDGAEPEAGLITDQDGNFYGTTTIGGTGSCDSTQCGTVFKIAPDGTESVLYSFQGGGDGAFPEASLIADTSGNLYGTTLGGGNSTNCYYSCGTVYKLTPDGTESVLYSFKGGSYGYWPDAGLIMDSVGNLYGTTTYGGGGCRAVGGCGIVFKLKPNGVEQVLFRFSRAGKFGTYGGANPEAGLFLGRHGILYGTAAAGGTKNDGVVFALTK